MDKKKRFVFRLTTGAIEIWGEGKLSEIRFNNMYNLTMKRTGKERRQEMVLKWIKVGLVGRKKNKEVGWWALSR